MAHDADLREREERLRIALQASGMGSWDHDLVTGHIVWPEGTERLFDVPPGWFDGRYESFASLVHPDDLPQVGAAVADAMARVGEYDVEFRAVTPKGEVRWMHARGRVLPDPAGRPARLIGVGTDVTRRRSAEDAWRAMDERYRAFIANSSEGIWRFDVASPIPVDLPVEEQITRMLRDGVLVECNDQTARMYGLSSAADLIGARAEDLLVADDPVNRQVLRSFVQNAYVARDVESHERGADGRDLWFLNSYRGVVEDGGLVRVWGTQRDVTAIKASEARYRNLVEHVLAVIYESEPGRPQRLAFVSPQVERMLGHSPESLQADPELWPSLIHAEDRRRVLAALAHSALVQEPFREEYRVLAADGKTVWLRDEATWMPGGAGGAVLQGVMVDVTTQRRFEEALARQARELNERSKELARSNAELERFAYVASHDLQEPLRMVLSFGQLLSARYRGRLDADADEFLEFMQSGARRMSDLIHDLLHLSRVGSQPLTREEISLDEPLDQALLELKDRMGAPEVSLTRDPLPSLAIDRQHVVRLFLNLVGNALKFRSAAPCRIHVAAAPAEEGWTISVEDNGIGVDVADRERIFEVFRRGRRAGAYPGTGIGLAICKRVVERHGGRIWNEPLPGGGTAFRFTLPLKPSSVPLQD